MAADAEQLPPVSLLEISRVLEETARLLRRHAGVKEEPPAVTIGAPQVRAVIAARWLRRKYLGFDITDAVWSLMLELYAARLEDRGVSQTRLCIAAGVPQSTALHLIRRMLETGAFTKNADPIDKRLLVIGLSDATAERMRAYLVATYAVPAIAA